MLLFVYKMWVQLLCIIYNNQERKKLPNIALNKPTYFIHM